MSAASRFVLLFFLLSTVALARSVRRDPDWYGERAFLGAAGMDGKVLVVIEKRVKGKARARQRGPRVFQVFNEQRATLLERFLPTRELDVSFGEKGSLSLDFMPETLRVGKDGTATIEGKGTSITVDASGKPVSGAIAPPTEKAVPPKSLGSAFGPELINPLVRSDGMVMAGKMEGTDLVIQRYLPNGKPDGRVSALVFDMRRAAAGWFSTFLGEKDELIAVMGSRTKDVKIETFDANGSKGPSAEARYAFVSKPERHIKQAFLTRDGRVALVGYQCGAVGKKRAAELECAILLELIPPNQF